MSGLSRSVQGRGATRRPWSRARSACVCAQDTGCAGGRGRRAVPLSCTERERPLAGAVPFHRARADYDQRSATCAGRKRACCASSRERASAVAQSRVRTRASGGCAGDSSSHGAAWLCTEGERPLAGVVAFHRAWSDYNQRSTARARRKRACCASSPQRANNSACAHTRKPAARRRPWLARRITALHRRREPSRWCSALS